MPNTGMIKKQSLIIHERRLQVERNWDTYSQFTKRTKRATKPKKDSLMQSRHVDSVAATKTLNKVKQIQQISAIERRTSSPELRKLTEDDEEEAQIPLSQSVHAIQRNKLAPFSTLLKASTCGYNLSPETDFRKKRFSIMPANRMKWRSKHQ